MSAVPRCSSAPAHPSSADTIERQCRAGGITNAETLQRAEPSAHGSAPTRPRELAHGTDADLARALLANEPSASRLAWQRFFPVMSRKLRRALGPGGEIEDIAQDAFLSLFGSIHRLRDPNALRAFVLAITRRALSQELRRRRTRVHLNLGIDPQQLSAIGVVRDAASHHAFVHLELVLARLGERDRRAFILRFVERMEAEEVAEALGVSVATARRCFSRARKRVVLLAGRNAFLVDYVGESGTSARPEDV